MSEPGSTPTQGYAKPISSSSRDDSSPTASLMPEAASPDAADISPDDRTLISRRPAALPGSSRRVTPGELGRMLVGDRLDHFELIEYVGGGGMGAVFRARDTMLNREVALKVLSRDQGADTDTRRRFQNE